jgi:GT2 family glycosyltransferase
MTAFPSVDIIVLNWNGKRDTLECLTSLRGVTYPACRVIVVDNGSTDDSVAAIRQEFPGTVLVETGRNLLFAGGNNAGIRKSLADGTDIIMLLNNDTVVDPGFVEALVRRLQSDSSVGVVGPKILYYAAPKTIWYAGGDISLWTGTMKHRGIRAVDDGSYDVPGTMDYATGCCLCATRAVWETAGLLDESYAMYAEDADWCMRARKAGFGIGYEPSARVFHKISVSAGGHTSLYKLRRKFLSNFRFFFRHSAWYQWPVFPWLGIIVNAAAAGRYFLSRRAD